MLNKYILLILSLVSGLSLKAQSTSSSPFSSSGIGEEGALPDAQFGGFGNISSLSFDSTILNTYNPASYSNMSFGQPLFSVGISSKFSTYSSMAGETKGRTTGISNFSLGVPIGKRFGIALGLKPFSRKGYEITRKSFAYDDSVTHIYSGSGSTNLVFGGLSFSIINSEKTTLSIGANMGYIFGSAIDQRISVFQASAPSGGVDMTSFRMKSLYYSFGAYYRQFIGLDNNQQFFLSAVYTPQLKLTSYLDYELYYMPDVNYMKDRRVGDVESSIEPIDVVDNNKGSITFPSKQTIAVGYAFSPHLGVSPQRLNYQLLFMGEIDLMQWSRYSENFSNHTSNSFSNTFTSRLGMQFIPNIDRNKRSSGAKYFSRIKYRVGAQYGTLPFTYNGTQYKSLSGTLGFGLPFLSNKTNSSVNLSVQYGSNNNGTGTDLREKFFSFSVGIIIAPSSYERWFRKYKLD